ncbi:aminoglycoside 3-N-acetyltransferase [Streptomyces sp. LamerLS-316]|uniref:aminoglycoside N(3)-acetyltransferase n=1 Tax=unclassified Streptomyces TaxID=2593676 RepID=UPI000823ACFE|nr:MULTISPECIES: AAC(3) family N-acetyltransferase [unclassified Streptomyces]SCK25827.1 aminoglycoside 3-N-acetyltransferase [Streptomyces sp. LamerLS-316]
MFVQLTTPTTEILSMPTTKPRTSGLTSADLVEGWRRVGVEEGMAVLVHSSLSSLGRVDGGAVTVIDSLRTALGHAGTLVAPTFTWQVTDPDADHVGVPDAAVNERRAAVPTFHPDLPSTGMGAVPEVLRSLPGSVRSSHPQASVAAIGARAADIARRQTLGFAIGRTSPFGRLHDLGGYILLMGVGHNRNTFLHHAETLTPNPRLKVRRFPRNIDGERVWIETLDVGNDNDRHFPTIGREFEEQAGIEEVLVGDAPCRLIPVQPLVSFAVRRLTELLEADQKLRPR